MRPHQVLLICSSSHIYHLKEGTVTYQVRQAEIRWAPSIFTYSPHVCTRLFLPPYGISNPTPTTLFQPSAALMRILPQAPY